MNLKESFRYQNFLESMMGEAGSSLIERTHAQEISKRHLRNKANPDAQDIEETMDFGDFYKNDDVLAFMSMLVEEKSKLTNAISRAKARLWRRGFSTCSALCRPRRSNVEQTTSST